MRRPALNGQTANTVGVREVSRLISRIRHRQFGVLVTTSAVARQAYEEVREDRHPIIFLSGKDIAEILTANGFNTRELVSGLLQREFPVTGAIMEVPAGNGTIAANAWLAIDTPGTLFPSFTVSLPGERKLYAAIAIGDWLLLADPSGKVTRIGRVLRLRSDLENTVLYLDRLLEIAGGGTLASVGLTLSRSVIGSRTELAIGNG